MISSSRPRVVSASTSPQDRRHIVKTDNRRTLGVGLAVGIAATAITGMLMGQAASQPVKAPTEYFVTGEGDEAHLWVREGTALRCVGHGECAAHAGHDHKSGGDHKEGDGHDHGKPAPKK